MERSAQVRWSPEHHFLSLLESAGAAVFLTWAGGARKQITSAPRSPNHAKVEHPARVASASRTLQSRKAGRVRHRADSSSAEWRLRHPSAAETSSARVDRGDPRMWSASLRVRGKSSACEARRDAEAYSSRIRRVAGGSSPPTLRRSAASRPRRALLTFGTPTQIAPGQGVKGGSSAARRRSRIINDNIAPNKTVLPARRREARPCSARRAPSTSPALLQLARLDPRSRACPRKVRCRSCAAQSRGPQGRIRSADARSGPRGHHRSGPHVEAVGVESSLSP